MRRVLGSLKKFAIFCHRWMGVAFCLLFAWWFISGIFMMYWDYPEVGDADRLARAPALDAAQVRISPERAYAALERKQPPDGVKLSSFDGRPTYRIRIGRDELKVWADSGTPLTDFPPQMNRRTAAAWTGQPANAARMATLDEEDQWTVAGTFRAFRPLERFSWPNGEQVYVSEITGEVVQYTTPGSRLGAYLGAIPHWLYFTPLRKNPELWSKIVTWASGIATLGALLGLIVGLSMYSPSKRYRSDKIATSIPYRGQKRLHMILGLFFGIVACTWAFSGMLSMEPFPLTTGRGGRSAPIPAALRGGRLRIDAFAAKGPADALAQAASEIKVKEIEFTSFAGEPVYLATKDARHMRIIPVHGEPMAEFDINRIRNLAEQAARPQGIAEARLINEYDAYYLDRHGEAPLPVLLIRLNDSDDTRYYIDPRTARIVGGYSSRSWMNRWLYHGLHSLNLPWLYKHRPAWDIVVLVLLLGGVTLSATSVIIAFQLLRRKFA
jgi:hypothetical protein